MTFKIGTEDPGQPEILSLLKESEVFAASLYPAESNHFLSVDELRKPNVRFFVARDGQNAAVGTGAVAIHDEWAEVKRMWVTPSARGQGISKALLARIELEAVAEGVVALLLETGVENHAALALYKGAGFKVRGPFADYVLDPLSVFMEKRLR